MTNKSFKIADSSFFLIACCLFIFLLSIYFRSIVDIGADTGVYLAIGKRIANGGKYYYDFFESNFPLSFYFYALQYKISQLIKIDPIILSEIVINFLGLLSIFCSAQILKSSTIYQNKAHYNLIIIGFFCGFFLRPYALQIGEFGTKTSLLLILLYPYFSFCFERKENLNKKNLIRLGILMGLIPCLKPHYLVFILFAEIHKFLQKKSVSFFFQLDKLIMYFIGAIYLLLMIKFTPEFFEFMVPMWKKTYSAFELKTFLENVNSHFAARISIFAFIFLIFARLQITFNDKVLSVFFAAASILMVLENIGTIDQIAIFFAITTVCFFKLVYDLFLSKKIIFLDNQFIILSLAFIPIFDLEILPASIFGLAGIVNVWWMVIAVYPFLLAKKLPKEQRSKFLTKSKILFFLAIYFVLIFTAALVLKFFGGWSHVLFNLTLLWIVLFFFEKKVYAKFSDKFSTLFVFVICASISCIFYCYISSFADILNRKGEINYIYPSKFSDFVAYYSKKHAPKKDDSTLMFSIWIAHKFPLINYLHQDGYQKVPATNLSADLGSFRNGAIFSTKDLDLIFALSYLLDDAKNQMKNPHVKVIFINKGLEIYKQKNKCLIGTLEYLFLDPEFKKIFLQNFHFENRVLITKKTRVLNDIKFITGNKSDIFDEIKPSNNKIYYDFDIYVRNAEN
jgi:hypothetical protein